MIKRKRTLSARTWRKLAINKTNANVATSKKLQPTKKSRIVHTRKDSSIEKECAKAVTMHLGKLKNRILSACT